MNRIVNIEKLSYYKELSEIYNKEKDNYLNKNNLIHKYIPIPRINLFIKNEKLNEERFFTNSVECKIDHEIRINVYLIITRPIIYRNPKPTIEIVYSDPNIANSNIIISDLLYKDGNYKELLMIGLAVTDPNSEYYNYYSID